MARVDDVLRSVRGPALQARRRIMMNGSYGMGSGGVLVWLTSLVVVALLVWLVVRFAAPGSGRGPIGHERPEEILDRGFAAGEIDADTYKAQRAALVEARKNH